MVTEMVEHVHTILLRDNWGLPLLPHLVPIAGFGWTYEGETLFGFKCNTCGSTFRSDYKNSLQFTESVVSLINWARQHQHKNEDITENDYDVRRTNTTNTE